MRITDLHIKDLEIQDSCPKCYHISSTDYSNIDMDELPDEVIFNCTKCQYQWIRLANQYWHMLDLTT